MSGDDGLRERVEAALAGAPDVEPRRMFGGVTFMVRGKMCISVGKGRLMCRIDPAIHDKAVAREGCRTVFMKGRAYRGYVYVDAHAVRTTLQLDYWIGLALVYNKAAHGAARAQGAKRRR